MRAKSVLAILLLAFFLCNWDSSKKNKEIDYKNQSEEIENAKWYFYSYAASLRGYLFGNKEINPLECDARVHLIDRLGRDTTKIYFELFHKHTANICFTKPYGLVGVIQIRRKLYLPIYHAITFEPFDNDSAILAYMDVHERTLKQKIKEDTGSLVKWLKQRNKL